MKWNRSGWPLHLALLGYGAIAMAFYALARLLFFLFNMEMFEQTSSGSFVYFMLAGMRFDLSAILYTNILFIFLLLIPIPFRYTAWYQKMLMWIFLFTNSLTLLLNLSDIIYYRFTLRRTTWSVFNEFANEDVGALGFSFLLDYGHIALLWIGLSYLMYRVYRLIKIRKPAKLHPVLLYSTHLVLMLVIAGLSIGGMRGGFRHSTRPITLSNAGAYVNHPNEVSLVLNTPFSMLRTITKADYKKVNHFPEEELEKIYSPVHVPGDSLPFQPKNVVVFVLESFSKEAIGGYNQDKIGQEGYKSFTPFLDSLMQHSKIYTYSFANGKKSIDALPSVMASVPSLQEPFVLTPYAASNVLPSLPKALAKKGYHTSFYHGAPNGSMGFGAFMNLIGVQEYKGMSEYGNDDDFDGLWGIWDEEFMQYFARDLGKTPQPFMSTLFSLSSHHPFKIPERYQGKFPKGPLPVYECISYTDLALKKFFETARLQPWFENTLFVITADHTATAKHYPEYQTNWGVFSIPIIFFAPGDSTFRGVEERVVQQLDIMPTVLGYLHYDEPYVSFGKDLLDPASEEMEFAINYLGGSYQWYEGSYMLQATEEQPLALYNYVEDKFLKQNLKSTEVDKMQAMHRHLKAFLQQYKNRMIDNRLQVPVQLTKK